MRTPARYRCRGGPRPEGEPCSGRTRREVGEDGRVRRRLPAIGLALAALLALPGCGGASVPACDVADAELRWGFKESFRAYIDGSIANGEWSTADGAEYATPEFIWRGGSGEIPGDVAFRGSVRFTGHGGILDTTIADPVVRFGGD